MWANGLNTPQTRILDLVEGCSIEFVSLPSQISDRPTILNEQEAVSLDTEIKKLLEECVVEPTSHCKGEFISTVCLTPKKDGSYRTILNLKLLNGSVVYKYFKMESLQSAMRLVTPGCYIG